MIDKDFYGSHATTRGAWRRTLAYLAATGACAALAACQSPGVHGARAGTPSGVVLGRVKGGTPSAPVVVVAIDRANGRVAQRAFLAQGTYYAMPVTPGTYKLYAFADLDRNGARGATEPASLMYSLAQRVQAGERLELPAFELRSP